MSEEEEKKGCWDTFKYWSIGATILVAVLILSACAKPEQTTYQSLCNKFTFALFIFPIAVMLKKKVKSKYGLYTVLDFGKYYGETVQDVIDKDPDYMAWCVDNIEWFKLDKEAEYELDGVLY